MTLQHPQQPFSTLGAYSPPPRPPADAWQVNVAVTHYEGRQPDVTVEVIAPFSTIPTTVADVVDRAVDAVMRHSSPTQVREAA